MMKLTVFVGLLVSVSCTILHQIPQPIPLVYGLQYHDTPNYNFAYEVNDAHTGDVKSQHESRRGETVLGQYTLVQPDGVRRTVDYRADEHAGFRATVNNEGRSSQNGYSNVDVNARSNAGYERQVQQVQQSTQLPSNLQAYPQSNNQLSQSSYLWPAPATAAPTPTPVAVSRSSFVQTFSHSNPWQ